jgi:hypothetical protein
MVLQLEEMVMGVDDRALVHGDLPFCSAASWIPGCISDEVATEAGRQGMHAAMAAVQIRNRPDV